MPPMPRSGVVAPHPDALVVDQYLMELADSTRIDVARLRERLEEVRRRPPAKPVEDARSSRRVPNEPDGGARSDRPEHDIGARQEPYYVDLDAPAHAVGLPPIPEGAEREALRLAVQKPEVAARLLEASLFAHPTARAAFDGLVAVPTLAEAIGASAPEVAEELTRLSVEDLEVDATDVLARLATEIARTELVELEREARSAEDPLVYSEAIAYLKVTLEDLRRSLIEPETVVELLDWLKLRRSEGDRRAPQTEHRPAEGAQS